MSVQIALVQTPLVWEDPAANRAAFERRFEAERKRLDNTDLLILPEMFSTGFSMASSRLAETMTGPTVTWMREQAAGLGLTLCGSVIISSESNYYNRFVWASPDGSVQHYDKKHLFRMSHENDHYAPGTDKLIVNLGDLRVCPQVCYDLRFPVWQRQRQDYDVLLLVANWPASRRLHWRTLLQARAIENQCYVVGVNRIGSDDNGKEYAGDSLVFDFAGQTLCDLGDQDAVGQATLAHAPLQDYRLSFPAWRDADDFRLPGDSAE